MGKEDRRNHPILVHCNKGKHRTGCLIGCLRKIQHWSLASVFDEYRRFSWPKSRELDLQCIEAFDIRKVWWMLKREPEKWRWLPKWDVVYEAWLPLTIVAPLKCEEGRQALWQGKGEEEEEEEGK